MKCRNIIPVIVVILVLIPSSAIAFLGGASDGGCCGAPPELEGRARLLENSFSQTATEDLSRQRWARTLCKNHPCDGEVTEDQAKDLLNDYASRKSKRFDDWFTLIGLLIAGASFVVSFAALRQSARNERDIGRLQERV